MFSFDFWLKIKRIASNLAVKPWREAHKQVEIM